MGAPQDLRSLEVFTMSTPDAKERLGAVRERLKAMRAAATAKT